MSDGSVQIIGDLQFIGYKQKANFGVNNQVLTYKNGEAVWDDGDVADVVTSNASQDVIIDNNGIVVRNVLNTYSGIDTKPVFTPAEQALMRVNSVEVNNIITGNNLGAAYAGGAVTLNVQSAGETELMVDGGPIAGLLENALIPIAFDGGTI